MGTRENLRSFELMKWSQTRAEKMFLALVCSLLFTTIVLGQKTSPKTTEQPEQQKLSGQIVDDSEKKPDKFDIPDLIVSDQNGKELKFYTDLIKGKKVIVNFVFTTCNGICPPTGRHFSKLQTALGTRLGNDVFLVTITTDPKNDTPQQLKAWTEKLDLNPARGWTLVTGSVENITRLLRLFTGDGPNTGYHVPAVCVIDDTKKSQNWNYGLAPIEEIIRMVDSK